MSNYPNRGRNRCFMALGLIAIALIGTTYLFSTWGGGWELTVNLDTIIHDGDSYSVGGTPKPAITDTWGSKSVHYDVDTDYSGDPDIVIILSNVRHYTQDVAGYPTYQPLSYLEKAFDENNDGTNELIKRWEYHRYLFDIDIRTDADVWHQGVLSYGEVKGLSGSVAKVEVRTLFDIEAWQLMPQSPTAGSSAYIKQTGWSGILSAQVTDTTIYVPEGVEPASGKTVEGFTQKGGALNMYTTTGSFVQGRSFSDAIANIPNELLISVYVEILGGYTWPLGGSISVQNAGLLTTVGVDVITSCGYKLQTGVQTSLTTGSGSNTGADPIGNFFKAIGDALGIVLAGIADWFSNPLNVLIIAVIAIFIIFVVFKIFAARLNFAQKVAGGVLNR